MVPPTGGVDEVPWRTDRQALDAPRVRALLAEQFPDLKLREVARLGAGWDFETWEVDAEWVFRFPKRAEVEASMAREAELLPLLARHLEVRLPVPEWMGEPSAQFPFGFCGYRLVPGRAWDWTERPKKPLIAFEDSLVGLLNGLHGLAPAARALLAGAGRMPPEDVSPLDWRLELVRVRGLLEANLESAVFARALPLIDGSLTPPPAFAGAPVLLHYDLAEPHLLLDDDRGNILGVIDWSDAGFGDPVMDFIEPVIWLGPDFLERVLARYVHPVDAGFRARVRHGASVIALLNLAYAVEQGDALRAGRRRCHLEGVLVPNGEFIGE